GDDAACGEGKQLQYAGHDAHREVVIDVQQRFLGCVQRLGDGVFRRGVFLTGTDVGGVVFEDGAGDKQLAVHVPQAGREEFAAFQVATEDRQGEVRSNRQRRAQDIDALIPAGAEVISIRRYVTEATTGEAQHQGTGQVAE